MGGDSRAERPHRKTVYLAAAYTKGDVALNVRAALLAADRIWRAGHVVIVPHLCHFWHLVIPHPYEDWIRLAGAWLELCDVVVRLPGDSDGADGEDLRARELGIPVYYSVDEFLADHPLD